MRNDMAGYRRIHLLLEGRTEETIVRDVFLPCLVARGWHVTCSILTTREVRDGKNYRGGVSSWSSVRKEIRQLLRDTSISIVSTVIDYYGFPSDAPGMNTRPVSGPRSRVEHVEKALYDAIGDKRFLPHLTLRESESWVFAAAEQVGELSLDRSMAKMLEHDVTRAGGPELVNGGVDTAPSKRLKRYWPEFEKTIDGPLAIADLGLPALREQCPHLDAWLARVEQAAN